MYLENISHRNFILKSKLIVFALFVIFHIFLFQIQNKFQLKLHINDNLYISKLN